jgi:hypothetical protein
MIISCVEIKDARYLKRDSVGKVAKGRAAALLRGGINMDGQDGEDKELI